MVFRLNCAGWSVCPLGLYYEPMKDNKHLDRIEANLQRLFEGGLLGRQATLELGEMRMKLADAMRDAAVPNQSGRVCAPQQYGISVSPADFRGLNPLEEAQEHLALEITAIASALEMHLTRYPKVTIQASGEIEAGSCQIETHHVNEPDESTATLQQEQPVVLPVVPPGAALLYNGTSIPLTKTVINLGRHRDNDIILDSATVSRHQAQMRLRSGHFMLFDISSKGTTHLNGTPVSEAFLKSGDVMLLAGETLVYHDDHEGSIPIDEDYTRPFDPDGTE